VELTSEGSPQALHGKLCALLLSLLEVRNTSGVPMGFILYHWGEFDPSSLYRRLKKWSEAHMSKNLWPMCESRDGL
jgi:hypothetical protein